MKRTAFWVAALAGFFTIEAWAAEVMPPKPAHYFNDYAGIISQSAVNEFDRQLAQFDRETSNQVVVAIFPKMQSDSDIADYTQRVAQSWGVGQKDRRNGVVLFVFVQDKKMLIQIGYGLEGALPDAKAFDITEYKIKPAFMTDDYEGGIRVGIDAICAAIRGEYSPTPAATEEEHRGHNIWIPFGIFGVFILLSLAMGIHRTGQGQGHVYSSSGRQWTIDWGNVFMFWVNLLLTISASRGGGGSSSGGRSSGFSGGGGSFGGGGAGSSW